MKISLSGVINPGEVITSRVAKLELAGDTVERILSNHCVGCWGELPNLDVEANLEAVNSGHGRVVSIQETLRGKQLLVLTELDSRRTTVQLPWEFGQ